MKSLDEIKAVWSNSWGGINYANGPLGQVQFTGNDVRLYLPLYQTTGFLDPSKTDEGLKYASSPFLYGRAEDGHYLVLVGATSTKSPMWIRGRVLLISEDSFEPSTFIRVVYIKMRGFEQWLGDEKPDDSEMRARSSISLFDGEQYHLAAYCGRLGGRLDFPAPVLAIEPKCQMQVSDILEIADLFSSFVSFCCGFDAEIESILIGFSDTDEPVKCFAPFVTAVNEQENGLRSIPLSRESLRSYAETGISSWLMKEGELVTPRAMLRSLVSKSWALPLDLRFLAAAQILEVLAKVSMESTKVGAEKRSSDDSEVDYEETKRRVLQSIKDEDLRRWTNRHLKKRHAGVKPNQAERLRALLSKYELMTDWLGITDKEVFIQQHIDSRNYYTHRMDAGKYTLYGSALHWHYEIVLLLCQCVLGDLSGIPEGIVVRSYEQSGYGKDARKQYATVRVPAVLLKKEDAASDSGKAND